MSRPIRALIVIPALGPVYGGPSQSSVGLAGALGRRGIAVDVLTTDANGRENLDVPLGHWQERELFRVLHLPRVGHFEFKFSIPLWRWLMAHVQDYDVVHGMSVFTFPVLAYCAACRRRRVPYIIHPQGMFEPWALGHRGWKKRLMLAATLRDDLRHAAVVHCLTQREAQQVHALGVTPPTTVIANGIHPEDVTLPGDPERFLARFPELRGKTRILFLHRIDPKKGLDLLALAFGAVRDRFPDARLILAGPTSAGYGETARKHFANAGVADRVTWTGILTGEDKRAAFAAADLFVTPTYSEGFSMSVLEAMAAGVPNLMTTGCNFPEAAAAGAAREVPIDAGRFAESLTELLTDREAARAMGARGREFILGNYTWDHAAAKTEDVYRAIIAGLPIPHTADFGAYASAASTRRS